MLRTRNSRERLRLLGQRDLGAAACIITGEEMWSIQRKIARSVSRRRSQTTVPSCNASGKTWMAARIAAAFYETYTPGTPCLQCDPTGTRGGCRGSKVITTSSKEEHLKDNLWGELQVVYRLAKERGLQMAGRDPLWGDLKIVESEANHFITGQSASTAEGMQGYHAAHKLIIGDEATSVSDEVKLAITRLLSSGDSRLFLIYNPTTPDTYASQMSRSPKVETIRITAYDTPMFTGEHVPEGANLITPEFLESLEAAGMGPGTFEWVTSIEAKDWDMGDDLLVPGNWYDLASGHTVTTADRDAGVRQLGVDLASYGSDECVITLRIGNKAVEQQAYPSMRMDTFFETHVTAWVERWRPHYLVYDADGVGAGVIGYADAVQRHMAPGGQVIGFRGGMGTNARFRNARAAWYWTLRRLFENHGRPGGMELCFEDDKLRDQLTDIHYSVTPQGDIRVETKDEMKKRGRKSPDRADSLMYAFAFSADLEVPPDPTVTNVAGQAFPELQDNSEEAMWERERTRLAHRPPNVNPVLGLPD